MNKKSVFLLVLLPLSLTACGNNKGTITHDSKEIIESEEETYCESGGQVEASSEEEDIYVYVGGEVENPGVYVLKEGSRVYEAVNLAGGSLEDISLSNINPVDLIKDGDKIIIKNNEEGADEKEESEDDGLININTADETGLTSLPGIGSTRARAIIAYREENGAFKTPEDIKNVDGIKDGVYSQIEGLIKTE